MCYMCTQRCFSHSEKKANMYFAKRTTDFWVVTGRCKHESLCDWHWLCDLTFGWAIVLMSCIPVLLWPHCLESTSGVASSLDALQEKHCIGTGWCTAHCCKDRVPIETAWVWQQPQRLSSCFQQGMMLSMTLIFSFICFDYFKEKEKKKECKVVSKEVGSIW